MGKVTECGLCGSSPLLPVLNLGQQPLAERDDGFLYPLRLMRCPACSLAQLSYIVDQETVFPPDHPYAAGNTAAMRRHADELAATLIFDLRPNDLLVDIGANDGTLLFAFRAEGVRRVAVEPTRQAQKMAGEPISVYQAFFTEEVAKEIVADHGHARVITACNVLAHVPDPHDFMEGVLALLGDDGTFITDNHDLASVTDLLQVDTIYHEHLRYYSVASLARLLEMHGLWVTSTEQVSTHGGSFRVRARKRQPDFAGRAAHARSKLHAVVRAAHEEGPVYGVGAATRATPLIHYAGLGEYLDCVCEVSSSDKIGMFMPGTSIPVLDEKVLVQDQPPHALLFAWHVAGDIIPKLRARGYKGKFIIPLPEARVVSG